MREAALRTLLSTWAFFRVVGSGRRLGLNYYRLEAGRFEDFVSYGLEVLRSRGGYPKCIVAVTRLRAVPAPDILHKRFIGHVALDATK